MVAEGQPSRYDAFVSYSHAADDLLAPRLQAGLQRFAKPWWRRRAIRVFRDESSLSASPHLWGSITEALDGSSWFVLLLSPEAAASEWVNKEIEHWRSVSSRTDRVLPVLTDGEFGWADGDVVGNAVPPALRGVFDSEPRWVDLRFAKGETQLDLKSPDFAAAVADVASAVRGIPKDELESEEVRQHRRTIRTAWAAGILVLVLGVAASVAAVFAFNEQARANAEADRANENAELASQEAERANENAAEAEAQRAEAESQRSNAEREATIARSQALVLEAEKALESDPELAIHLALAAIDGFQQTGQTMNQAVSALRNAVARHRITLSEDWEGPALAVDPSGVMLAHSAGLDGVVRDIESKRILFRCNGGDIAFGRAAFTPDGTLVFNDSDAIIACTRDEGLRQLAAGIGGADSRPVFSPDGSRFARVDARGGVSLYSLDESRFVHYSNFGGTSGPSLSSTGLLAYVAVSGEVTLVRTADGSVVQRMRIPGAPDLSGSAFSPDGSQVVAAGLGGVFFFDVDSGSIVATAEGAAEGWPVWVPSLDLVLVGGPSGFRLLDPATGRTISEVKGIGSGYVDYVGIPGTTQIAAAKDGPGVVVFDVSPLGGTEVGGWLPDIGNPTGARFLNDGSSLMLTDGESTVEVWETLAAARSATHSISLSDGGLAPLLTGYGIVAKAPAPDSGGFWTAEDILSGAVIFTVQDSHDEIQAISEDGSLAVVYSDAACTRVVDTNSGQTVSLLQTHCDDATPGRRFTFSDDGSLLLGLRFWPESAAVFDVRSGSLIANIDEADPALGLFSPSGSELVLAGHDGALRVLDLQMAFDGFFVSEATRVVIPAHNTQPVRLAVSPDGDLMASASIGEPVRLWDVETGELLHEFGGDPGEGLHHTMDFHPTEPWLLVASPPNEVRIYTLDIDELISIAESRLTRELTETECQQYPGACPAD